LAEELTVKVKEELGAIGLYLEGLCILLALLAFLVLIAFVVFITLVALVAKIEKAKFGLAARR